MILKAFINNLELKNRFNLTSKEGKDLLNRFISEIYNIFYYFDDDDFESKFVELSTQHEYVFQNFLNSYFEGEIAEKHSFRRDDILQDISLLVEDNVREYIKEETYLRECIYSENIKELKDFKSRFLNLKFKGSD